MKIGILGCGAMGSIYAALLSDVASEVWAIDPWVEHVDAIRARGVRVTGAGGDRTVRLKATTNAADAGPCDLVVIAAKAAGIDAATASIAPLLKNGTAVLTIQNGLGSSDRVAAALPAVPIVIGIAAGFGASLKAPGHAHHNGMELIHLGNRYAPRDATLERIAGLWQRAGFKVRACDDIAAVQWEKLICNSCYSAVTTLTEWTIGQVQASPSTWRIAAGCASEAFNVARSHGVQLDFSDVEEHVRRFGAKIPHARSSMAHDIESGRSSRSTTSMGPWCVKG